MTLKAVYTKQEDIPEGFRDHYAEQDGMFVLDVEPFQSDGKLFALQDVAGLKNTVSSTREEVRELQRKLKAYDGIEDPEAARSAMAKLDELGDLSKLTDKDKAKMANEAALKDLREKHANEVQTVAQERDSYLQQLQETLVDSAVREALSEAKVTRPKVMFPHVKSRVRMVKDENTGKLVARVVKDDGKTEQISMKADSDGPMGLAELVDTFRSDDDFKDLFPGADATGIGVKNDKGGGAGNKKTGNEYSDPTERLKAARAAAANS